MAGKIWKHDIYNLRKYRPGSIDYFLDIGACVGTTSLLFKTIDPLAKVRAIEPCKEDFETMKSVAGFWGLRSYNIALGDGEPLSFHRRKQGCHCFYTTQEKEQWPIDYEYKTPSMTFPQLFKNFKIKGRYIIKVDCEGGERFLLEDANAVELIRKCVQLNIELHPFGGPIKQWSAWFMQFKDTHILYKFTRKYDCNNQAIYAEIDNPDSNNKNEFMLVRRDYAKPTDG